MNSSLYRQRQTNHLREIFSLSLPAIITNITTPLLGMTDVAIAGHLGSAVFIAAIAVGSNMFNLIYWLFGFLRMGSSGLTAQAYGARNQETISLIFFRGLIIAVVIGIALIIFSDYICSFLVYILETTDTTMSMVTEYFKLLIFGAPAVLGTFAITGWLLGMQNSKSPMWISIFIDILNIGLSLTFVIVYKYGIIGLALGTLVSQWCGFILAIVICITKYKIAVPAVNSLFDKKENLKFFKINTNIFLRTVCLVAVTMWFTRIGSQQGDEILAANSILLQLFTLFSFFMDGFAFAGEALSGKYKGAKNRESFLSVSHQLIAVSIILSVIFTTLYILFGQNILNLLCSDENVIERTKEYFWWAVSIPIAGFMAFTFDGIYIGATETGAMLLSVLTASIVFFCVYMWTNAILHNHGLWLAFISYLVIRGVVLLITSRRFYQSDYFR